MRSHEITRGAMVAASSRSVRSVLIPLQRSIAREVGNVVCDGRDQGSVVFPAAEVKFYVVADADVRAKRRLRGLCASGCQVSLREVVEEMSERDRYDQERDLGPLIRAPGSHLIDTSRLLLAEVVDVLERYVFGFRGP